MDKLRAHLRGLTGLAESTVAVGDRTYRISHPASADDLLDEEDFDRDERLPYWAELWPSAVALARYLSGRALGGRRVIELGCGVGLPTILSLAQGAEVLATDHYEAALDFTVYNARANLDLEPEVSLLDWREPHIEGIGTFDLVLGADVLYEGKNAVALADLVPRLLAPGGEAIFADPRRDEAAVFLDALERQRFEDTTDEITIEQSGKSVKVLLHRLRR